jgi:hypothetical protein
MARCNSGGTHPFPALISQQAPSSIRLYAGRTAIQLRLSPIKPKAERYECPQLIYSTIKKNADDELRRGSTVMKREKKLPKKHGKGSARTMQNRNFRISSICRHEQTESNIRRVTKCWRPESHCTNR